MFMRRGFGLFWALVTVTIASLTGWFAYNAGLAANIANSGHGTVVVSNGSEGFPFFPLVLLILFIAFMFRRRRWGGGWGHGQGWGHNRSWGEVPPVIDDKLKSWHEKAHGAAPAGETADRQAGS